MAQVPRYFKINVDIGASILLLNFFFPLMKLIETSRPSYEYCISYPKDKLEKQYVFLYQQNLTLFYFVSFEGSQG